MPIIEIEHVTKEFRLGQLTSLAQSVKNGLARLQGKSATKRAPFKALDEVSFAVEQGEVLGIIGENGAGKSTLLKLLARISQPTRGTITVRGRVAPLIEVGAGLVPDMTGRENIFLNAAILGMKREEVKRKFDEIVAFAELEEFIDTPIKRYSSGMQVRLGFSIATAVDSDLLIVDEVLAVGDLAFQRKCHDRLREVIEQNERTVVVVSHNLRQIEQICNRVMFFERGKVIADGDPAQVCELFYAKSNEKVRNHHALRRHARISATGEINITSIDVVDRNGERTARVAYGDPFSIRFGMEVRRDLKNITMFAGLHTTDFVYVTANETFTEPRDFQAGRYVCTMDCTSMIVLPGVYSVRVRVSTIESQLIFSGENMASIQVFSDDFLVARQQDLGLIQLDCTWRVADAGTQSPQSDADVIMLQSERAVLGEKTHTDTP